MLVTVRVLWHATHPTSAEIANLFQCELQPHAEVLIEAIPPSSVEPSEVRVTLNESDEDGTLGATIHMAEAVEEFIWKRFGVNAWLSILGILPDNDDTTRFQLVLQRADEARREIRKAVCDLRRSRSHDSENAMKIVGEVRKRLEKIVS